MSAFKNDGSVQYGSRVLTINSVAYVADNVAVERPSKIIERTNEIDEPSGWVGYAGFVSGTAQIQLASGATVIPVAGFTFSTTFVASIDAETFTLTDVSQPEEKGGEKKVNISFKKNYN